MAVWDGEAPGRGSCECHPQLIINTCEAPGSICIQATHTLHIILLRKGSTTPRPPPTPPPRIRQAYENLLTTTICTHTMNEFRIRTVPPTSGSCIALLFDWRCIIGPARNLTSVIRNGILRRYISVICSAGVSFGCNDIQWGVMRAPCPTIHCNSKRTFPL